MDINDFVDQARKRSMFIKPASRLADREVILNDEDKTPLSDMPEDFRQALDMLGLWIVSSGGGANVMISGDSSTGKTFLWEQLIYNIDHYLSNSRLNTMKFFSISEVDMNDITSVKDLRSEVEALCSGMGVSKQEVCLITKNADLGLYLATSLPEIKIILEIDTESLKIMGSIRQLTTSRAWDTWRTIDMNEVGATKDDMVKLLMNTIVKKIARSDDRKFTQKQVVTMIDEAIKGTPEIVDDENYVIIPPGIWSSVLTLVSGTMSHVSDPELQTPSGAPSFVKHLRNSLEAYDRLFAPFVEDEITSLLDSIGAMGADGAPAGLPPGVSIMSLQDLMEHKLSALEQASGSGDGNSSTPVEKMKFGSISTLEKNLKKNVLGQETAIDKVLDALVVPAAGLHDPNKPLRSFIFVGPTGVGKTQLSKELAKSLATKEIPVVRIDMSEFQQPHDAAKLFGAPPGYTGHDRGGVLTSQVSQNPACVLLLDEVEKAHPQVWDTFLQVLDSGRMTDSHGTLVDFTQTVVIMTSNVGVSAAQKTRTGFIPVSDNERVEDEAHIIQTALKETFRPEFLNRVDEIVQFGSITREVAAKIVFREVGIVESRMTNNGFSLSKIGEDVVDHLLSKADIARYGAREVQRVVYREVANPVARHMVVNPKVKNLTLNLQEDVLKVDTKD